jgi:hypothetical protein
MPQGQSRVRRRSERVAYERDSRKHHGYAESPAKLLKAYEEGLERTRLRLEQQREELRHLARVRRQSAGPRS